MLGAGAGKVFWFAGAALGDADVEGCTGGARSLWMGAACLCGIAGGTSCDVAELASGSEKSRITSSVSKAETTLTTASSNPKGILRGCAGGGRLSGGETDEDTGALVRGADSGSVSRGITAVPLGVSFS